MKIELKFPDNYSDTDVQPFLTSISDRPMTKAEKKQRDNALNTLCNHCSIDRIGYRVFGQLPMVSIQKKNGCLIVEIDEQNIVNETEK